jgi:hypothetical protein
MAGFSLVRKPNSLEEKAYETQRFWIRIFRPSPFLPGIKTHDEPGRTLSYFQLVPRQRSDCSRNDLHLVTLR